MTNCSRLIRLWLIVRQITSLRSNQNHSHRLWPNIRPHKCHWFYNRTFRNRKEGGKLWKGNFWKHCVLFVLKIMFVWIIRFFLAIKVNCAHITDKQITPVIRVILLCPVQRIQGEKSAGESQTHTKRTFSKTHLQQRCLLLLLWKYSLHSQWLLWSGLSKMASGALIPQMRRGTVSHCHNTIVSRGRIRPGINISNG